MSVPKRKLRYSDFLEPFEEYIKRNFKELDSPAFRTYCTLPGTELDLTPQRMRRNPDRPKKLPPIMSYEEVNTLTEIQKKRFVETLALSVNDSPEAAIESAMRTYRSLMEKGKPKDEIERWKKERGNIVVELNVKHKLGLISEFTNHHANLLLYEDVKIEETILPNSKPIIFYYEDKENEDE